ncbi:WhiB family redox-sensing transcriptional regulator [Nonomuraea polychroma]|jgi:WhiB family redox-sensing transcriptional regulator|uniref:Transcriptional regulator WhiB n=2 Tax=Nonomuraea polychroma TaxID=46176 RepID=A0A438M8S2_9ACTN|nr:WhiB family redox-sensing transcriptional regulator [Nonomuraea polychroma]
MMMMLDWTRRAACLDLDPELFFPISMEGPSQSQVERAKSVCHGCAVREPCLEYALATRQAYGVWGGTDPEQRRELSLAGPPRESVPAQPLRGDR